MRILAFADNHGNLKNLESVKRKAKRLKPEIILCAGDFTFFEEKMDFILKKINALKIKTLIVPGNHEDRNHLRENITKYKNIEYFHASAFETEEAIFLGYEGNGFSKKDKDFKKWWKKIKKLIKKTDKKIVLITHAPPYNTKLDEVGMDYVGNETIRKFIEKEKPVLAISGHIHDCFGVEDKIGNSLLVNPGPNGKIIEI